MKNDLMLVLLASGLSVFLTREFFPRKIIEKNTIPVIIPQYDTVEKVPDWYVDSVAYWKSKKYTSEKVPLLITQTLVDTEYVPVPADTALRPNIWPVLTYNSSGKFGDSAYVSTFNLRSGKLVISRVFVPGILIGIDSYYDKPTPRLDFMPFPVCPKPSFLYRLKMMGIGGGIGYIGGKVF